MGAFWGRIPELLELKRIDKLKKSALVVCLGRRRIGKSRLIQEFGKKIDHYIEIQGLAPRDGQTNQNQIDWFSKEVARQTELPEISYKDWSEAFILLANYFKNKHCVIFLDEISWMGGLDKDFPGKLKIAWDTHFSKNKKLRLVICGSVSSWIQKNILNSTDFVGRISLELVVKEMSLKESMLFFGKKTKLMSDLEKLRILCLTGGVPRYLEEMDYTVSAELNYKNLCFSQSGFLFTEFKKIFNDIFGRRSTAYLKIIKALVTGQKNLSEIAKATKLSANGVLTEYLEDLEISGFIRNEKIWDLKNLKEKNKSVRYKISDNYIRFYIKYILPNHIKIEKNLFKQTGIEKLHSFDVFVGLQFENIIINNLSEIYKKLELNIQSIQNVGGFFQNKTNRQEACQVDLLIQTRNTLYVAELKARRNIDVSVVKEVQEKIKKLKYPSNLSIRPILIYAGELCAEVEDAEYFDQIINFADLLM